MTATTTNSMLPYQAWVFESICEFCLLDGAVVMEVGGVPNHRGIADNLIGQGASKIIQINNRNDLAADTDQLIQYLPMDARNCEFPDASFDVVFSASVLEHLLEINSVLSELHRVLKPGGILCLHGGAFWNCAWGHHVWVRVDGEHYAFNGNNPLPDWSHLYLDRAEMKQYLVDSGIAADHAERIAFWVYDSHEINRLTYDNFVDVFNRSEFDIVSLTPKNWKVPDDELKRKLIRLHGTRISNYSIGEAVVVLRRKAEDPAQPQAIAKSTSQVVLEPAVTHSSLPEVPADGHGALTSKQRCYERLLPIDNERYESILEHLYSFFLNTGDAAIDIGAHKGRHLFPMIDAVGESGRVFAFEPIPDLYQNLEREIVKRCVKNNVQIFDCALSRESGTANFLCVEDALGLSGLVERSSHQGHSIKEIEVLVRRLDEVIPDNSKIRFIKVDAEGADFFILLGARRILENDRPLVVFESGRINAFPASSYKYSKQEFLDFFAGIDYVLFDIVGLRFDDRFWDQPTLNDFVAIPVENEEAYREMLQLAVLTEFAN